MKKISKFTSEEINQIEQLLLEGKSYSFIATATNRPNNSIYGYMNRRKKKLRNKSHV